MRVPRTHPTRRHLSGVAPALLMICSLALCIGCVSWDTAPSVEATPFSAIPCEIDSTGTQHVAVFQSPTPGYAVTLSRVLEGDRRRDVYVTIRAPHPAGTYAQVIVEQRVATGVAVGTPVRIYARLLPNDAVESSDHAYGLAATSR